MINVFTSPSPPLSQCLSEENYVIAHYDLRPPNVPAYGVSGNTLTVYEAYSHIYMGELVVFCSAF